MTIFNEFTQYIDFAQVSLYLFWAFFFGLVFWLRREDRREGYPVETDNPRIVRGAMGMSLMMPSPKTFVRPDGSTYTVPNPDRDTRDFDADRTVPSAGSPYAPKGDALLSGVGPASYQEREDEPELTREGHVAIVPMRVATDYSVAGGPDPRGWDVVAADKKVAASVKDIWVDRSEMMVRYLEVELPSAPDGGPNNSRLLPITMLLLHPGSKSVEVASIKSDQFGHVPSLKAPDKVTLLEEEKIQAFYAGGRLYADAKRAEPIV